MKGNYLGCRKALSTDKECYAGKRWRNCETIFDAARRGAQFIRSFSIQIWPEGNYLGCRKALSTTINPFFGGHK